MLNKKTLKEINKVWSVFHSSEDFEEKLNDYRTKAEELMATGANDSEAIEQLEVLNGLSGRYHQQLYGLAQKNELDFSQEFIQAFESTKFSGRSDAHYLLGSIFLSQGRTFLASEHFLKTYANLPLLSVLNGEEAAEEIGENIIAFYKKIAAVHKEMMLKEPDNAINRTFELVVLMDFYVVSKQEKSFNEAFQNFKKIAPKDMIIYDANEYNENKGDYTFIQGKYLKELKELYKFYFNKELPK